MNIKIRPEIKSDYSRITEINDLAFGQKNEGKLIENLRQTPDFVPELSLVAERVDELIGHILLYPVKINSGDIKHETLALAPISVIPEYQIKGVGSRLVKEGLKSAKRLGYNSVIVLGHPGYYPKFGYERASRWGIKAPFDVPDEVFLAIELKENSLRNTCGLVEYPKEFMDV